MASILFCFGFNLVMTMKINSSKGFSLIELMLVLVIIAGLAILDLQRKTVESYQVNARNLGVEIFRISNGVQNWISHNAGNTETLSNNGGIGVKTGFNWLKSSSCGGSSEKSFLPCDFLSGTSGLTTFGKLSATTTVTDAGNGVLEAVTVFDELLFQGSSDYSLSGIAALVASGAWSVGQSDPSLFTSDATIKFCITAQAMPACAGRVGRIVVVSTTQSLNDRWLRVDHGNNMQNAIEFDKSVTGTDTWGYGFSLRQIKNVARIYNEGNGADVDGDGLPDDALFLGKRGAPLPSTVLDVGVVVDADQATLGKLDAFGDITANSADLVAIASDNGTSVVGGNVRARAVYGPTGQVVGAGGNVIADADLVSGRDTIVGSVQGGSLTVLSRNSTFDSAFLKPGDIRADLNLLVGQDATIENDALIKNDLIVEHNAFVQNDLTVEGNALVEGVVTTQLIIDYNDPMFMIDPNENSFLRNIYTENVSAIKYGGPQSGKLNLRGDEITFGSYGSLASADQTKLVGNVDVENLNIKMASGNFVSLKKLLPSMVLMESFIVNNGGVIVTFPQCSTGGVPKIFVIPQKMEIKSEVPEYPTGGGNGSYSDLFGYSMWRVSATVAGNGWVVSATNGPKPTYSNTAIAQTYCSYD